MRKYGAHVRMAERIPDVLSGAMGNQMYVATFDTRKELDSFYDEILKCRETDGNRSDNS